ncbi:MAG: Ig-like domain-containing protein [Clostridia bacterium]|nr:Ig-like domain-containing protein [Clostridia bacterium]
MKYRWIARVLALALLMASVVGFAGVAEGFGQTPSSSVKLGRGETCRFDTSAILVGEGQVLKYKSDNPKVATVDADGVITALRKGKATVAVGYDKTLLGVCHVTVVAAPKRVTLSDSYAVLSVGDVKALTAKLPGGSASALSFTSSNDKVATVDGEGNVTAIAGGKTTVMVRTYNDIAATCDVYVLGGKAPTTLSLNVTTVDIQVGETFRLSPSVDEGSDAIYKYASQNRRIASVNSEGVITGMRKGTTSVAVKTHNGLIQAVEVNVKARLKDAFKCLTNDPATYMQVTRKLDLTRNSESGDNAVTCQDGELSLTMTASSCTAAIVNVLKPRYCIAGIDVTMTPENAAAKLLANGWALTATKSTDGVEQRAFTKADAPAFAIAIATADGATIQGIMAQWNWG